MPEGQALVLGGGGVAGIAWMTGLLAGLADAGQDVTGADLLVGTSAGSAVAAQVGSGLSLDALFARQVEPALQAREISVEVDMQELAAEFSALLTGATSPQDVQRRVGAYALAASTVSEADRLVAVSSRLPSPEWPARRLLLVAVDAETGETRVFDRESGVDLVDAVAASCAVPGIWPPVTIGGRRYVDGGVRSSDNADLAAGYAAIVVISPLGPNSPFPTPLPLRGVVEQLRAEGSAVTVIAPDEASVTAIGTNPLDPATRVLAAQAGRAQGRMGQLGNLGVRLGSGQALGGGAVGDGELVEPPAARICRRPVEAGDVRLEVQDGRAVQEVDASELDLLTGHLDQLDEAEPDRVNAPRPAGGEDAHRARLAAEQKRDLAHGCVVIGVTWAVQPAQQPGVVEIRESVQAVPVRLGDLDDAVLRAGQAGLDRRGLQLVVAGADHSDDRQPGSQFHNHPCCQPPARSV
jgi:NTE family protein